MICDINNFLIICFEYVANNDLENFTLSIAVLFLEVITYTSSKALRNAHKAAVLSIVSAIFTSFCNGNESLTIIYR